MVESLINKNGIKAAFICLNNLIIICVNVPNSAIILAQKYKKFKHVLPWTANERLQNLCSNNVFIN